MQPSNILEAVVYADDLIAARDFYVNTLGLDVHSEDPDRHVFFKLGETMFLVFKPQATSSETVEVDGQPIGKHGAVGPGHIAFRVDKSDVDDWRERLIEKSITIESEVNWPNGGRSLYFRDPAGNSVELATPKLWGIEEDHVES